MDDPNTPPKQQWEMLASPGHVLLSQVSAYKLKTQKPIYFMLGAVSLVLLTFFTTPYLAHAAGSIAGWITSKASSALSSKPLEPSTAPQLSRLRPVLNSYLSNSLVEFSKLEAVKPAMEAQVQVMTDGKRMEDCNFSSKINQTWFDGIDVTPKCRYSQDKTRLWVWAVVNVRGVNQPWAGLVVKMDGKVTLANVDIPGIAKIEGIKSINPDLIPRTVANDFPELAF